MSRLAGQGIQLWHNPIVGAFSWHTQVPPSVFQVPPSVFQVAPEWLQSGSWLHRVAPEWLQSLAPEWLQSGKSDTKGIRTPAGRAQWISRPIPLTTRTQCHSNNSWGLNWLPGASKCLQVSSRCLQVSSRCLQVSSRWLQSGSRVPKAVVPEWLQSGSTSWLLAPGSFSVSCSRGPVSYFFAQIWLQIWLHTGHFS